MPDNKVFPSGAVRSKDADNVRYDLISDIGLRRVAETYAEGAKKYSEYNWLKGIPASDLINHLSKHISQWKSGDRSEDHLAHAAWGLFTLMHFEETRDDLMDIPTTIVNTVDSSFTFDTKDGKTFTLIADVIISVDFDWEKQCLIVRDTDGSSYPVVEHQQAAFLKWYSHAQKPASTACGKLHAPSKARSANIADTSKRTD